MTNHTHHRRKVFPLCVYVGVCPCCLSEQILYHSESRHEVYHHCELAYGIEGLIYKQTVYHNVDKYEVFHQLCAASCVVVDHPELKTSYCKPCNNVRFVRLRSRIGHSKTNKLRWALRLIHQYSSLNLWTFPLVSSQNKAENKAKKAKRKAIITFYPITLRIQFVDFNWILLVIGVVFTSVLSLIWPLQILG